MKILRDGRFRPTTRRRAAARLRWRALLAGFLVLPAAAEAQSLEDLGRLSIEDLGKVEITSVSKRPEALSDAPAAIYVITHDEIVRSGATTLPEILRMAPNLFVAQTSPSNYVISARGLNGSNAAQNFSNKLLVVIDGRSVYTPLYSGVYWDMQDVLPEDIERIEIISGPGATLWGANAVNGVINITTRKSADTQGGVLDLGVGNLQSGASLRYGGRLDDDVTYRLYAKGFVASSFDNSAGANARDGWSKPQGGFRLDWTPAGDQVTLQGDVYRGPEDQGTSTVSLAGANVLGRWQHRLEGGSTLQLQTYYDQASRFNDTDGSGIAIHTYDLELQHSFALNDWNNIVWGAGDRIIWYSIKDEISPASSLMFVPEKRTLNLANVFVEDRIALTNTVQVTLGMKLENDPYSGIAPMPSIRASWKPTDGVLLWSAVSRAIRSPTPFDRDLVEKLGSTTFLTGGPNFQPEKLTSYEIGYRGQITPRASISVSAFKNVYDDLRSIELSPTGGLPLQWGNMMQGDVYGVETWGSYQVADWWRLTAAFSFQHESLRFKPGASTLLGVAQAGDDPHHQASLRSSMNLTDAVTFDADLRYVGILPNPRVPDYVELNARLGWAISDRLAVSLSGYNLIHAKHQEFTFDISDYIKRSFFLETHWKF